MLRTTMSLLFSTVFSNTVIATASIILCIILASIWLRGKQLQGKLPPCGSEGFFSTLSNFLGPKAHQWLAENAMKLKSKIYRLPLTPPGYHFFVVADANISREILNDPSTMKLKLFFRNLEKFSNGPNLITSEGFRFKHARKAIMPVFRSNSTDDMIACISKIVDLWIVTKLEKVIQNGDILDINSEMQRVTSQIISEFGFNYTLSEEQISKLISNINVLMQEYMRENILNPTREYLPFFFPGAKAGAESRKYLLYLTQEILDAHRKKGEAAIRGSIIDIIDKNPNYVSDHDRAGDIGLFIGAGFETTAGALSWAIYLLAKNVSFQAELRKVISSLSETDAYHHNLVRNVIREALRLYPPGPIGTPRVLGRDYSYSGLSIPKGSIVTIPPYVMHRDPDYFERPDEFLPSRWDNPTPAMLNAYQPFSIGRRNCMGMSLAQLEAQIIIVKLIKDYQFYLQGDCDCRFNLVLYPHDLKIIPKRVG
jgi:cytochrome P450